MAIVTSKNLVFGFTKADGSSTNMTVADYREGITDTEIEAGGKGIVAQGIFTPDGFALTALASAQRIDTTKSDVVIAE